MAYAGTTAEEAISVWVYAIFTPDVSNNLVRPYFHDLEVQTDREFRLVGSTDVEALLSVCESHWPQLMVASVTVSDRVERKCGYRKLAISFQQIKLILTPLVSGQASPVISRVGSLADIRASEIGQMELAERYSDIQHFTYKNYFELIKYYRRDKLDAIIMPYSIAKTSLAYNDQWRPVYDFKEKGIAAVLASPLLDKALAGTLQSILLANGPLSESVWQKAVGLGPFVSPELLPES